MGKELKVVFMGTPEFAVTALDEITKSKHKIVGVVTVPDKPSGRGLHVSESAVKKYALQLNVPILQPEKLKSKLFIQQLTDLKADVFVVVAFRILPKEIFTIPKMGTFNLHASLLPQLRGAAPINFAIINGLKETGVTTFFLDEKVDTGEILLQEKIEIEPSENAGSLHDKLMDLGKDVIIKTLDGIAEKTINPKIQANDKEIVYAPKIEKEDCEIDWKKPVNEIHNFIRGMSPYPCAFTTISIDDQKKILKIFEGKVIHEKPNVSFHTIETNKKECKIALKNVWYSLEDVQLEGKKRMKIKDFLNGIQGKNLSIEIGNTI